jgi:hypothetical protein
MIPAVLTGVPAQPLRRLRILEQIHHGLGERRGVPVRDEAAGALVLLLRLRRTSRGIGGCPRARNTLNPAARSFVSRSARVVIRIGSTALILNGSMMVRMGGSCSVGHSTAVVPGP